MQPKKRPGRLAAWAAGIGLAFGFGGTAKASMPVRPEPSAPAARRVIKIPLSIEEKEALRQRGLLPATQPARIPATQPFQAPAKPIIPKQPVPERTPAKPHYKQPPKRTKAVPSSQPTTQPSKPIQKPASQPVPKPKIKGNERFAEAKLNVPISVRPPNPFDFRLQNRLPSLSPTKIDSVLKGTPMHGLGQKIYYFSIKYGIDPAPALAFWRNESLFGSKGAGARNNNPGNLRNKKGPGFQVFPSMEAGTEAWFRLIAKSKHYLRAGRTTVDQIAGVYAPPSENATNRYVAEAKKFIEELYK